MADDHQAAQSIGIPLNRIWVIVWCVAGVVALVAGMIWGSKRWGAVLADHRGPARPARGDSGRPDFGARAIIGGLIIGVGEKLSEVYLGPFVGGASRSGLRMCWRWCSFSSGLRACSGEKLLIAYEIRDQ